MFTDWSQVAPDALEMCRYFYARGALWGVVAASTMFLVVVPWVKKKITKEETP